MNQARASRITGSRRISYRCSIRFTCSCVTCPMAILLECFRLSAEIALDSAQSSKASRDARPPVARLKIHFCKDAAAELASYIVVARRLTAKLHAKRGARERQRFDAQH